MSRSMKSKLIVALLVTAVAVAAASTHVVAEDKKPATGKKLTSKGVKHKLAAQVNFTTALGLPFHGLTTLGSRIDQARADADPVLLASLARELAIDEEVAGKKASITAEGLRKQAIKLAKTRAESAELKAVALAFKDTEAAKELLTLSEKAKVREEAATAAFKSGERSRGVRTFVVFNNTAVGIIFYANGRRLGYVGPSRDAIYNIGDGPGTETVLLGRNPDGTTWGPESITEDMEERIWDLTDAAPEPEPEPEPVD